MPVRTCRCAHRSGQAERAVHRVQPAQHAERDAVIATDDRGQRAGLGDIQRARADVVERALDAHRHAQDIAAVGAAQVLEQLETLRRLIAARERACGAHAARAEARAGPIRRAAVEWRAADQHVDVGRIVVHRQAQERRHAGEARHRARRDRPKAARRRRQSQLASSCCMPGSGSCTKAFAGTSALSVISLKRIRVSVPACGCSTRTSNGIAMRAVPNGSTR